jgi:hypothetical protein
MIMKLKPIQHEEISEQTARDLITTRQAGYWEASLRDSISKQPIPHTKWVCIFVDDRWFKVPGADFQIVPHGRVALGENADAALHMVECHDAVLAAYVMQEVSRRGKPISGMEKFVVDDPELNALAKKDAERIHGTSE